MKKFWEELNKPTKVLGYLVVSTILSEVLIELGNFDKTFIVRISAQLINLVLVTLEAGIKKVRSK